MKKFGFAFVIIALLAFSEVGSAADWQQRVEYSIKVSLNAQNHQMAGEESIKYYNNSPDTLNRLFYHLYFNAFQPGSMMDVRSRTIKDPDPRVQNRIATLKPEEMGMLQINSLTVDGTPVRFEHAETILEVWLDKPILPRTSVQIKMDFNGQVPVQIRRSGRDNAEGISYTMTQWYPKLCEYDEEGWHSNPYIAREFHGVWGDFNVEITMDSSFVIGGTGTLENAKQIGHGYAPASEVKRNGTDKLTWKFWAENVHDFAWAADPDYTHTQRVLPSGLVLHFFYEHDSLTGVNWPLMGEYMEKAFAFANENFGKYPYPQYSFIQGGDGGMEYPMATMITGRRGPRSLVGVSVHEAMHSWYQGVLATNESLYAWMDEGFTSYASAEIMKFLYPEKVEEGSEHQSAMNGYRNIARQGFEEPSTTHADHFQSNWAYGVAAYSKGEVFLHQLGYIIGKQQLKKTLLTYFDLFQFKHPKPTDFKRIAEKISGLELDWYFEQWIASTNTINYGILSLQPVGSDTTRLTLQRKGNMMMPIEFSVQYSNGSRSDFYIPLRILRGEKKQENRNAILLPDWPWTHPAYGIDLPIRIEDIDFIEIDTEHQMADLDLADNRLIVPENWDWSKKYIRLAQKVKKGETKTYISGVKY